MLKGRKLWFLTLLVGFMMVLAACTSSGGSDGGSSDGGNSNGSDSSGGSGEVPGVTDDEILVGHVSAQTGPQAIYGQLAQGIQAYFDYVNENGGVHGRQLKLIAYDGEYTPSVHLQQVQRLIEEDGVFAMVSNSCTPCNTAAQEYFNSLDRDIVALMTGSGAEHLVNPINDIYLGSSIANYRIETKVFYDFAVNELGAEKIAIVYQNDDYGLEGFEAVQEVKDQYDAEIVAEVPTNASDEDFTTHAQKVRESGADTVIMLSTPNPASKLKQEFHAIGLDDVNYIVSAVGGNDLTMYELAGEEVWEGTYSAGTVPVTDSPDGLENEAIQRYVEIYSEAYPGQNLSGVPQWGYGAAEVFVEAIERAGEDLNYDTFREALYTMDNWDESTYAGVTFNEENHYGLTSLFMTKAQNGTIEAITGTITFDPATGDINYE